MTTTPKDGGLAFPLQTISHGMTLRDYFAGQALAGLCANMNDEAHPFFEMTTRHMGELAYNYADAMIAARETDND
jgi:hypothetical protein